MSSFPEGEARVFEWFLPRGFARDMWLALHRANRLKATAGTKVVFLGDSITESWSSPLPWCLLHALGVEPCFDRRFTHLLVLKTFISQLGLFPLWLAVFLLGSRVRIAALSWALLALDYPRPSWLQFLRPLKAVNMGIGGDRTRHLQWRINHGELDNAGELKLVVLLIGVNNFNFAESNPEETASGILACAHLLLTRYTDMKVLIQYVFPAENLPDMREKVKMVNEQLHRQYQSWCTAAHGNGFISDYVELVDVGCHFLDANGALIGALPDKLHLNEDAYRIWAAAIHPHALRMLKDSSVGASICCQKAS